MEIVLPVGNQRFSNYSLKLTLAEVEKAHIIGALELHKSKILASESLGITIKTLYNKIHEYGLWDKYRDRPEPHTIDLKNDVCFRNGNWDRLSKTQVSVALLMLKTLNNPQIAEQLGLSPRSVSKYVSVIYRKTSVSTRYEFIVKFSKIGQ